MRKIIFYICLLFSLSVAIAETENESQKKQSATFNWKQFGIDEFNRLFEKAVAYENGIGVEKDEAKAFEYYQEAATYKRYREPKAYDYLEKKANEGNVHAQYWLGIYYCDDELRSFDSKKAFELFNEAAQKDYPPAIFQVAWKYIHGLGVEKDEKKAVSFC